MKKHLLPTGLVQNCQLLIRQPCLKIPLILTYALVYLFFVKLKIPYPSFSIPEIERTHNHILYSK